MAILVTGVAGFIGSHLVDTLINLGEEVWVVDDLSTGNLQNVFHLFENPHFHFVEGSVLDESKLKEIMQRCRIVYHLAAVVGVKLVVEEQLWTIETNVRGTELVLKLALQLGCKVLITSTSEVYGKDIRNGVRFREDDDLTLGTALRWGTLVLKHWMNIWLVLIGNKKDYLSSSFAFLTPSDRIKASPMGWLSLASLNRHLRE